MKKPRQPRHCSLQYEVLERREVMTAGVTAALNSGVLNVIGTAGDDQVYLRCNGKLISIAGVDGSWTASNVKSIVVNFQSGGNDFVSINSLANGGNKALKPTVTVLSGAGSDQLRLADGRDVFFSGFGHQVQAGASVPPILDGAALNLSGTVLASLKSGVLTVTGTNFSDNIAFRQTSGKIYVNGVSGSWAATKVKSIVVRLQYGDDRVSLDSLANGGNQLLQTYVTVYSGYGADTVHVANGHDVNFSGIGHTLLTRPDGSAVLDGVAVNWNLPAPSPITLSGTAWEDRNGNGVRDTGEGGLAGWHILVNGVDRASTDANGNWQVANLTPGTYTVQEVAQSGWTQTSSGSGYTANAASGATISNLSFGDFQNVTFSGNKWEDHNGNGLGDSGDLGLAGWHILINGVDRATTDATGNWSVSNLGPGSYSVQEVAQSGWTKTAAVSGYTLNATSGANIGNLSFGDFQNVTLSGTKWEDHNGNGLGDSGDLGLAGWHILINGVDRATTDSNGNWSVANVGPGSYAVQEVSQAGWTKTAAITDYMIAPVSGTNVGNLSFGDFKNFAISGIEWEDHNGNGVWEAGDQGLSGWHILINGVDRATTDANGYWIVTNLGPGSYTVQEVAQSNWTKTFGSSAYSVPASSGTDVYNRNFGDFLNVTLSGTKWEDHNNNGVRDSGDEGLAGWHILVNGVDRATTDANGNWSVSNVGPGAYSVQEISQTDWVETYGAAGYSLTASSGTSIASLDFGDFYNAPAPPSTNWFDTHVTDAALRSLGHNLYTDNLIDRSDMIALLRQAEDASVVDATELADLRAIVANTSLFGSLGYVDQLAADIVNGSPANASYQGQALGNLAANSSSTQMENLIDKWFLGLDHPNAVGDSQHLFSTYRQFAGSLFVNGATYDDVRQGYLGDCYIMTALAETALLDSSAVTNMFIVNGDGTYTVKFYNSGQPVYVTVDSFLPSDVYGRAVYAGLNMVYTNTSNELWVALAEKAYVQLNELGWERLGQAGNGQNAYTAIDTGYTYAAFGHVSGLGTVAYTLVGTGTGYSSFVTAFNAGELIGFASKWTPASTSVVASHAYAVVGYDAVNQTVTLFNPWGIQYGLLTLNWAQIQQNFDYFDRTV